MKILRDYKESDLLFIDIETARGEVALTPISPMYEAWQYKSRYSNEFARKTGVDMTAEEFYTEKAALFAPFSRIVCIVVGRVVDSPTGQTLKMKEYAGTDEKKLLEDFIKDLAQFTVARKDAAFCGFNNIGFDQPFIAKRMLVHGLTLPDMLDTADKKPWEIKCIDLSKLWQASSFYPDSLLAVSAALGLPSPKTDMSGSEVGDYYYAGKLYEIVKYCKADVLTTANIYRRFSGKSLLTA